MTTTSAPSRPVPSSELHNIMRYLILLCAWIVLQTPSQAPAQQGSPNYVTISSSPIPVGAGARAAGTGNAFIAVADDATAASWNPAGLCQLERPEVSAVGSVFVRRDDFQDLAQSFATGSLSLYPGAQTTESLNVNFLSVAYPFEILRRNLILSLNYQKQFDLNRNFEFQGTRISVPPHSPEGFYVRSDLNFSVVQEGSLYSLSPALAVQITPVFSLGATLNVWGSPFFRNTAWDSEQTLVTTSQRSDGDSSMSSTTVTHVRSDFQDFMGVNATFGLLWNITGQLSFGAVVELPFRANVDVDIEVEVFEDETQLSNQSYSRKVKMEFPISYGLGLAWQPRDPLTLSLDYMRVEWGNFIYWDAETGDKYSVVTGEKIDNDGDADVDATDAVRFGVEYVVDFPAIIWPLRVGVFYEPEPAKGAPNTFIGFSLGTGIVFKRITIDLAYVCKFGRGVYPYTTVGPRSFKEASEDVQQHTALFSSVIHF